MAAQHQTWIKYFFDTTGFFEGQNLTRKHRDSRQNVNFNQSKNSLLKVIFEAIMKTHALISIYIHRIGLFNLVFKFLPNPPF